MQLQAVKPLRVWVWGPCLLHQQRMAGLLVTQLGLQARGLWLEVKVTPETEPASAQLLCGARPCHGLRVR